MSAAQQESARGRGYTGKSNRCALGTQRYITRDLPIRPDKTSNSFTVQSCGGLQALQYCSDWLAYTSRTGNIRDLMHIVLLYLYFVERRVPGHHACSSFPVCGEHSWPVAELRAQIIKSALFLGQALLPAAVPRSLNKPKDA